MLKQCVTRDATFQKGFKTQILQLFSQIQVVNYGHIPSQGNELHTVSNSLECQNYSSHLLLKHSHCHVPFQTRLYSVRSLAYTASKGVEIRQKYKVNLLFIQNEAEIQERSRELAKAAGLLN